MNKLYKWCLLSCMAATLSSCNDFLTEENPSGLTADTFYNTESGAERIYLPGEMVVPKLSFPIITRHYKVPAMR